MQMSIRVRAVVYGLAVGAAVLLLVGVPTGVIHTPWYTRMTPVRTQDDIFLALTALLSAALGATYALPAACSLETGKLTAGGFLSALAVGCPLCNKIVVMLLGVSGALTILAPLQPFIGVTSLLMIGIALVVRLRATGLVAVGLPSASS